jgi:glycogen synthase
MAIVTFYFQLHQPFRLSDKRGEFLWDEKNREIFSKVAQKCYLPATRMFAETISANPNFKICFSMSGTFLEQAQNYEPEVIKSLQDLFDAGKTHSQVEYLDETYYHSLVSLFRDPEKKEFREQVSLHREMMKSIFGYKPKSFRNTELMFNSEIGNHVADMGYRAVLCEQRPDMFTPIDGQAISPNAVFHLKGRKGRPRHLLVIPRNRDLSDDVAFRFQYGGLSAEKYAQNLSKVDGEVILLGYDYEHIGEHIWEDTGIFDFWRSLPAALSQHEGLVVENPTEVANRFRNAPCPMIDIHPLSTSSWADAERNTSGWLGSTVQHALFQDIEKMEEDIKKADKNHLEQWRHITTSDNLYYLHEGQGADRTVHDYFSPYGSTTKAAFLLTRNVDNLESSIKSFLILKKPTVTPVVLITPETGKLPTAGMGQFAQFITGKSGGLGDVIAALCAGFVERNIATHLITLNLKKRFQSDSRMSEQEWIQSRHNLDLENIHLISSSYFEENLSAYQGDPRLTAAEFQKEIVNNTLKVIRGKNNGRAIIHSHDWMSGGIVSAYGKRRSIPTLHTVHNTHTGYLPLEMLQGVSLSKLWHDLYIGEDWGKQCVDCQATAIKSADLISFVGKRFLDEVVQDHFSDRSFIPLSVRQETKVKCINNCAQVISNGISSGMFPERQKENPNLYSPGLAMTFSPSSEVLRAKRANLVKFQKQMKLIEDENAILFFWPSRLDPIQKGVELLEDIALKFVIEHPDVQIAIVGDPVGGDQTHSEILGRIACTSNGKIAFHRFNEDLCMLGYAAASDVFGASLYEPFGQIDVVGNIYGATATNRNTGGYADKIIPLTLKRLGAPQDRGNGFLFKDYDSSGLWWGMHRSVEVHRFFRKHPNLWEEQMKRIMLEARNTWSLENMVAGYVQAYEKLNGNKPLS